MVANIFRRRVALGKLGFSEREVVRTRMYLTDIADAESVGRVHGRVFAGINPAATMVQVSALIDPRLRVEIELEAVRTRGDTSATAPNSSEGTTAS